MRPIPGTENFEIIAGHNRTAAGKLNGWAEMPAEVIDADDARATAVAIATNLMRRQGLSIIERGKAYKALLSAKNRNGQHGIVDADATFGETRQRYNARTIVADFFGVTEYEIRKAIKLTQLVPALQELVESKRLNLSCAERIADYDAESQQFFVELCSTEKRAPTKAQIEALTQRSPPPVSTPEALLEAWQEIRAANPAPTPRRISFDRRKFAPYLTGFSDDGELERLFLEFLQTRTAQL